MLKRLLSVVLLVSWLLPITACSSQDKIHTPVKYYYLRNEIQFDQPDGVIVSEVRESNGYENNHEQLLRIYLSGPHSDANHSPFPQGIHLVSVWTDDTTLIVTLSDNFADLSGRDLTLACICLAMTAMEITNAESVRIQTENIPLDGKMSVNIDRASIQFMDDHEQYIDSTEQQ